MRSRRAPRDPIDSELARTLAAGCSELQAGRPWHAHEAWEAAWKALPRGPARDDLQALIMLCGAAHLIDRGRFEAARRLLARARQLRRPRSGLVRLAPWDARRLRSASLPESSVARLRGWRDDFARVRAIRRN
jgi:hypothetical protein